jgi:sugar lactone lactonase YvrE
MNDSAVVVLSDVRCQLGEGPTYEPDTNTLFWLDILGSRLLEKRFPHGEARIYDLPFMASALGLVDADRQLLVTENGLYVRNVRNGVLTLHTALEADNPVTRSNDARVHPSGAFWIGTMGKNAEYKAGAIYWFLRGEVRLLYPEITIPNSICFSPDGSVGYFADSRKNMAFRVDCSPETGLPTGEPQVFLDLRRQEGGIDGSVVDSEGILWNAYWGGGRVDAYTPNGVLVRSIAVPARQTSCPAFVGPHADRMAVTTAWEGMDEAALQADPEAGKAFLTSAIMRGRFEPKVLL